MKATIRPLPIIKQIMTMFVDINNEFFSFNIFNFMIRPGVLAKAYKHERLFAWGNVASGKTTEEGAEEEGGGANNPSQ